VHALSFPFAKNLNDASLSLPLQTAKVCVGRIANARIRALLIEIILFPMFVVMQNADFVLLFFCVVMIVGSGCENPEMMSVEFSILPVYSCVEFFTSVMSQWRLNGSLYS
jgi:hypothetical protein